MSTQKNETKNIVAFVIISLLFGAMLEYLIPSKGAYEGVLAIKITIYVITLLGFLSARAVIKNVEKLYLSLSTEDEKEAYLKNKENQKVNWSDWKSIEKKLTDSKPVEEEGSIILHHDYDGIKELDNNLPPWWLYGFYISIITAVIYMVNYHVFNGDNQEQEYLTEVAIAKKNIAAYEASQEQVDMSSLATGENSQGKKLFKRNCAVCHMVDGGGKIGPNLTDDYWILGGSIDDIYKTISEGGRPGKGMVAWKKSFSKQKIQELTAYVKSLKGTTPAEPKAPQGDLYEGE